MYKGLIDHNVVKEHPEVRGFAKNVFFFDHDNKETGGGDDSISKHNAFEVRHQPRMRVPEPFNRYCNFQVAMIKDLVKYLLRSVQRYISKAYTQIL